MITRAPSSIAPNHPVQPRGARRFAQLAACVMAATWLLGCPVPGSGVGGPGPVRSVITPPVESTTEPVAEAQGPTPNRLRLATWNIAWLDDRPGVGTIAREADDYARLAEFAERAFADADLVMLQEVRNTDAIAHVFPPTLWESVAVEQRGSQSVGAVWRRGLPVRVVGEYEELALETVREGLDLEVTTTGGPLRLLGIHLKSGCWGEDYEASTRDACEKLRDQLPILEAWIDARAAEEVAFAVLGDFNRRLNPADPFWIEIDDADPPGADLVLPGEGRVQECWNRRYPEPIDHIVLDRIAGTWWVEGSEREDVFDPAHASFQRVLSDHCPWSVELRPRR